MGSYDDGYWRGYKDGAADKKNTLINKIRDFHFNDEWKPYEVKAALLRMLEKT